jgi:hypothetical protein
MRPMRHRLALLLVLVVAAAPRLAWYHSHQPWLQPDSFGYLNVAREWRGERPPSDEWDEQSGLPSDNLAARTPGYPLFLNLVFAAMGHTPTPAAALELPRRELVRGDPARERHLRHLETDENVRAVQAAQLLLGLVITGLAFQTLWLWTGSTLTSAVGSLIAFGLNPIWFGMFEPMLLTETLAAAFLMLAVWLASHRGPRLTTAMLASVACGLAVVVRPPMLFSTAPIMMFLLWSRRRDVVAAMCVGAPLVVLALALVVNNGVRYGYWGFTSNTGTYLISHATYHTQLIHEPLRPVAERFWGNYYLGFQIEYYLILVNHVSYYEANRIVRDAAVQFIAEYPRLYAASAFDGMREFCSPTLRLFPGETNWLRDRFPALWRGLIALEALLVFAGVGLFFVRVPQASRLGPLVYIVSAVTVGLMVNAGNRRLSVLFEPLAVMGGVTLLHYGARRIMGTESVTSR